MKKQTEIKRAKHNEKNWRTHTNNLQQSGKDLQKIKKECEQLYNDEGSTAVYVYCNTLNLPYGYCVPCEAETPTIEKECALCGTTKKATQLNKDLQKITPGEWKIMEANNDNGGGKFSISTIDQYGDLINVATIWGTPEDEEKANAEHIVKCVNSHSELCAMLRQAIQYLNEETTVTKHIHFFRHVEELLTKVK